jgi:multiple sugar transport system substrate-binding protein
MPRDALVPKGAGQVFSPRLTRRGFLRMAGAAAVGTALSGCLPSRPKSSSRGGDNVQLVYQDWRTAWFPPMAQQMLEEFHASHPNIRVFYTPDPESFERRMLADLQAGTAPDVFQGCCTHFPTWAQMGYTLDLQPYVEADLDQATIDDWDPAQYRSFFTRDGQQFGLPKYHGALALYFNKDLFDEYGVDYPDGTWDHADYLAAMKRLTHGRVGGARANLPVDSTLPNVSNLPAGTGRLWGSMLDISWDRVQVHVNGWGGHFVDPDDPARLRLCEPEAMAAMEWLRARMWDDRVMAGPLDVQNMETRQAFIAGRVAMVEDGSWALKDILTGADFRIGVAPFPRGPVRRVTLASTDGFGIYAGTKHPDAAWELVKFLISKEYGRAMARANFLQPARASLLDEWVGFIRDEFPEKAGDVDIPAFADGQLKGYSVTAEIFTNMAEARQHAYDAWDQIFKLGQAPVEHMELACRQIQEAEP